MLAQEPLRADPSVVTPLQIRLLGIIAAAQEAYGSLDLRLEGGTALAGYYLHHRESEDLDIFGGEALDARDFRAFVAKQVSTGGLDVNVDMPASRGFAELLVSDPSDEPAVVRVQFGRSSPFVLLNPVPTDEGVPVASYRDVCAGKLHAICDRYEPRDFIDLHCILHRREDSGDALDESAMRRRFRNLMEDLRQPDPGLTEVHVGKALARGLDRPILGEFPLRLLVETDDDTVQATLRLAHDECARITARHARQGRP